MKREIKKLFALCSTLAISIAAISLPDIHAEELVKIDTMKGFMIQNFSSGKYLTVQNAEIKSGANVCQYDANGIAEYNIWYFTETNNGNFTIKSALDEGQYFLNTDYNNSDNIEIYENADENQNFNLLKNADGTYNIVAETSSGNKAVEIASASNDNGVNIQLGIIDSDSIQKWNIIPVTDLIPGDIDNNGVLNVFDIVASKKLLTADIDFVKKSIGDVNNDNNFNLDDVRMLQEYIVKKVSSFPLNTVVIPQNSIMPEVELPSEDLTLNDMPQEYAEALNWIWENRIVKEGSTVRKNLIFDQIVAGNGTLNYVVRWQSPLSITLEQRKLMENMLSAQINNWTKYLINYDGWKYDQIDVNIVGWAVADSTQIIDPQTDEIIYTDTILDSLHNENSSIPELLPCAPSDLSRAEHFYDKGYVYPGGYQERFDMYLWGTQGFNGGAGGDWGQRLSDTYLISNLNNQELHILEHEIGHGFGMTDFYEDADRPPSGFPENTIMWAGDSMVITNFDAWSLRYIWSQIKDESGRF